MDRKRRELCIQFWCGIFTAGLSGLAILWALLFLDGISQHPLHPLQIVGLASTCLLGVYHIQAAGKGLRALEQEENTAPSEINE